MQLIKNGRIRKEMSMGLKCKDREKLNWNSILEKLEWSTWRKRKRKISSCKETCLRSFMRNPWFRGMIGKSIE